MADSSLLMNLFCRMFPLPKLQTAKSGKTNDKGRTEQYLGLALEQRGIMEVSFFNPELTDRGFSGPCLGISDTAIHIDAPFHGKHRACFDETVDVRFKATHENITSYFRFVSVIRGYHQDSGFVLEVPVELHSGQRREFVRIVPSEGSLLHLEVWPFESGGLPSPPSFTAEYGSGRHVKEEIALENLSAGGFRLKIKKRPDDPDGRFAEGSRLLCFLRLKAMSADRASAAAMPQGKVRQNKADALELWLTCTIRYCTEPDAFDCVFLGVEHTAWAVPQAQEGLPSWTSAEETRQIPLLLDWIWKERLAHSVRHRQ